MYHQRLICKECEWSKRCSADSLAEAPKKLLGSCCPDCGNPALSKEWRLAIVKPTMKKRFFLDCFFLLPEYTFTEQNGNVLAKTGH